jgi:hypothetical protein
MYNKQQTLSPLPGKGEAEKNRRNNQQKHTETKNQSDCPNRQTADWLSKLAFFS